jgi:hypothetical protein
MPNLSDRLSHDSHIRHARYELLLLCNHASVLTRVRDNLERSSNMRVGRFIRVNTLHTLLLMSTDKKSAPVAIAMVSSSFYRVTSRT